MCILKYCNGNGMNVCVCVYCVGWEMMARTNAKILCMLNIALDCSPLKTINYVISILVVFRPLTLLSLLTTKLSMFTSETRKANKKMTSNVCVCVEAKRLVNPVAWAYMLHIWANPHEDYSFAILFVPWWYVAYKGPNKLTA